MNSKISIILPVYNVENYIEECIKSIMNQSYKNLEIIIVDDGSTDNSSKICQTLIKNDSRFKYYYKENGGLSDARNFGIDKSTGEYLTFIDSDDYIDLFYIEKLYDVIEKTQTELSICGFKYLHDDTGFFENTTNQKKFIKVFTDDEILKLMYSFENAYIVSFITAWGKLYKKSLFADIRYPVGKNYEDEFTTYKIYINAKKVGYLNEELYIYRKRQDSIMSKKYSLDNLSTLEALEERLSIFEQESKDPIETEYSYLCLLSYSHYMLKKNNFSEHKEIYLKFQKAYAKYIRDFTFKRQTKLFILKYFEWIFYKVNKLKGNNK